MKRTILLGVLSLFAAVPAFANESKLGLDAASQAKLQQTMGKYRAQLMPLRKDARQARQGLESELAGGRPDDSKVSALLAQLQNDRQQMMVINQARAAELKSELTPTQYAKLVLARHHFGRGHGQRSSDE